MSEGFSLSEMAQCATRELSFRRRVYPRLVANGRMKQEVADREIALMEAMKNHFELVQHPSLFEGGAFNG